MCKESKILSEPMWTHSAAQWLLQCCMKTSMQTQQLVALEQGIYCVITPLCAIGILQNAEMNGKFQSAHQRPQPQHFVRFRPEVEQYHVHNNGFDCDLVTSGDLEH